MDIHKMKSKQICSIYMDRIKKQENRYYHCKTNKN